MSSMLQNAGRIPQELVNTVLDELRGDIATLSACSLVCRPWTNPSQARIFSCINLLRENGRNDFSKGRSQFRSILSFCNFLATYPHIAPLVGTLRLQSKGTALPGSSGSRAVRARWKPLRNTLARVLPALTHLKSLELQFDRIYGWNAFSEWEGAHVFTQASPVLTNLELRRITFEDLGALLSLLQRTRSLEVLALQEIDFVQNVPHADVSSFLVAVQTVKRSQLKTLSLQRMEAHVFEIVARALTRPRSPVDVGHLRHLDLYGSHQGHGAPVGDDLAAAAEFLSMNQNSLEHFSTCQPFGTQHLCLLLKCRTLKTMCMSAVASASAWLDRICPAITNVSHFAMESLTVEISGHYSKHRLHDDSFKWRELDRLLAASALRQFTIIFVRAESDYQHYWDLNWAELEDFDSVLPTLSHSSRLNVQLEIIV
ncbi:hypothetical protein IW261DRAFT_1556260 [Armillaria novae-zelandiae]|uniref:F-box domain-containing protein n=1 Tax=Armillaria novae-zelandiae TaxID=153914 RepID=A0AA39PWL6_9AGAR|nr:hypothetical protein IW261DRAFT_1556260 [Armillaria novae-zelandiae]